MGNPKGHERTLAEGVYNGRRKVNGRTFLQFSVPVSSGAAGGPVVNDRGEVVGVLSNDRPGDRPLDLAVPVEDLRTLLASDVLPQPVGELAGRAGASCSRFGVIQCSANCWDGYDGPSCVALAQQQEEKVPGSAYEAALRGCQLGVRSGCTKAADLATKHHASNRPLISETMDFLLEACRAGERDACARLPAFSKLADRPLATGVMLDYLERACASEQRSACDDLARAYATGDGVKKSRKRAAEYRRRASRCGGVAGGIVASAAR
jgi:hypothetical protein